MRLDDFFNKIFRGVGFEEVPVITELYDNQDGELKRHSWRWRPGEDPPVGRIYFMISTIQRGHPRARGFVTTRVVDLVLTYVIVLDDVGTKVDPARILLQPSYKLETSPANFQWGYLLTYGSDPAKAAALIQGLIDAGLTDAGASGAQRIVRVPGSVNSKASALVDGAPFVARLTEEHWERTWTLSELELGFKVMAADPRNTGDRRTLEAGETDPTFEWLVKNDETLSATANARGYYDLECPWADAHTDGGITAGYRPGKPGDFHCLHGHCQDKHTSDFKAWIKERDPDAVLERSLADIVAPLAAKLAGPKADKRTVDVLAGLAERAQAWRLEQEARQPERAVAAPTAVEKAILDDLVHVASENRYWSVNIGSLIVHKAINDRYYTRMRDAGLLTYTVELASGKEKEKELAVDVWLKGHDDLRRAGKTVHRLGAPLIVNGDLNIAPPLPFDLTDVAGDVQPWLDIVDYLCGDEDTSERVLDWLAMVVGDFKEKPGWHLLIRSKKHGAGKNLMVLPLVKYLKPHHQMDVTPKTLASEFTIYLEKRLCTIDEMKTTTRGASTGHDIYNTLKAYLSRGADTITVRSLNLRPYEANNLSCWVLTSNETVPLPIEESDRRFMVIEAPHELMSEDWYFQRWKWIEANYERVIGWLQRRWDQEMTDQDKDALRGRAPMTQAKQDLIDSSASGIDGAVRELIRGTYEEPLPDLVQLRDVIARLETGKTLAQGLTSQINHVRVSDALKAGGALRVFGDQSVRGEGPPMRLWCVRGDKLEEYQALGHQGVRDAYKAMHGYMTTGMEERNKVVSFRKPHQT